METLNTNNNEPANSALDELYSSTLENFIEGSIIKGTIINIVDNNVVIDIGYKSEGLIPLNEFKDLDEDPKGSEVEVYLECLEDEDGAIIISKRRAEQQQAWDYVVNECKEGSIVEGVIRSAVKGGFIVDVGVEAFLPGSQLDVLPVRNPEEHVGKTYEFRILKINLDRKNIVVSRRDLIEESRRESRRKVLSEIQVGQLRPGVVKNITDFGAFVDLDGIDGLLHITDMTWGRINHPSEQLKIGDKLNVMVLEIDLQKERISLGLKQTMENPWEDIESRYPTGAKVHGKVVNLAPYGAFIELEEGVEGLVHVSEISWTKRVLRAADELSLGQEVDAVVLSVSTEDKKISLGIRQTEENPWEIVAGKYPIGSLITGKVRNFTAYGAFVEIEDGVDGMIHVSDMSWTRKINHPSELLKKNDEITAAVMEIDSSNQRISLGLKQAQEDPWKEIVSRYPVGIKVSGKVTKTSSFGAFVEIEDGIDGLVHISQISDDHVEKVKDVLSVGDEIEARVVKVDASEHRIGLSIKAAKVSDEEFKVEEDMLEGLQSSEELGDLSGAFSEALNDDAEEWRPGDNESKKDND
ncbi:MAG: 30S ribosomal protein S1 [Verrucomicrobiota bacterium]|nr:30S ribosomal protein S1 [Kiritimatiellaceae bacterium]MEC8517685.1 30S ribosomal protein S1 [Verrucomicrobiota bacterium]|tara:strand:+ start:1429 stop:3171 length:1743 start_codon:yes stop_codon:yes gene_type:complete